MTSDIFGSMPAPYLIGVSDTYKSSVSNTLSVKKDIPSDTFEKSEKKSKPDSAPSSNERDLSANTSEQSQEKSKPGLMARIKRNIAGMKKAIVRTNEYIKGVFGGLYDAVKYGLIVYVGSNLLNHFKHLHLPAKFLTACTAVAAMVFNLWDASLNISQKEAEIDHRWIGHKE